jgi:hypothetical protein
MEQDADEAAVRRMGQRSLVRQKNDRDERRYGQHDHGR